MLNMNLVHTADICHVLFLTVFFKLERHYLNFQLLDPGPVNHCLPLFRRIGSSMPK